MIEQNNQNNTMLKQSKTEQIKCLELKIKIKTFHNKDRKFQMIALIKFKINLEHLTYNLSLNIRKCQ